MVSGVKHIKTPEISNTVIDAKIAGLSNDAISKLLKIDSVTLEKYYADELENGMARLALLAVNALKTVAVDITHKDFASCNKRFLSTRWEADLRKARPTFSENNFDVIKEESDKIKKEIEELRKTLEVKHKSDY